MPTSSLLPRAAVWSFCVLALAVNMAALVLVCLSAANGSWANLPSLLVLAVGSGRVLANAGSLDCAT